eukprot:scaffold1640_cov161-Amphora_coffeaeformis.AAC.20
MDGRKDDRQSVDIRIAWRPSRMDCLLRTPRPRTRLATKHYRHVHLAAWDIPKVDSSLEGEAKQQQGLQMSSAVVDPSWPWKRQQHEEDLPRKGAVSNATAKCEHVDDREHLTWCSF